MVYHAWPIVVNLSLQFTKRKAVVTTPSRLPLGEPTQVQVGVNPAQIMPPYNGNLLIYNFDANNVVYVGYRAGIGVTNATAIQPQSSVVISGRRQLWAFASPGPAMINITPEGSYQGPGPLQIVSQIISSTLPSLIAAAVNAVGVPAVDNPAATSIIINQDVPAGGTFTTGHITMSKYQSWSMIMHADNIHNNVDTIPYMRVTMAWSLQSDNFDPVHVEDWIVPVTPFSFTFNYRNLGAGPCYSDTLDVTFTSYDTVINAITLGVFGSFRPRNRSVVRGQYHWTGSTPTESAGLGTDAILASVSGTNLAVGASTTALLVDLWHGKASLYLQSADAALDDLECHIQLQPVSVLPNSPDIVLTMDGSGNFTRLTGIDLPRRVCTMFFKNTGQIIIPSFAANLVRAGESE